MVGEWQICPNGRHGSLKNRGWDFKYFQFGSSSLQKKSRSRNSSFQPQQAALNEFPEQYLFNLCQCCQETPSSLHIENCTLCVEMRSTQSHLTIRSVNLFSYTKKITYNILKYLSITIRRQQWMMVTLYMLGLTKQDIYIDSL